MSFKFCKDSPNCYFKQQARAKEEIEKWKHQAELGSDTTDRLAKQFQAKEQECEELKKNLEEYEEQEPFIVNTIGNLQLQVKAWVEQANTYKQTLDEIKYACESECIEGITGYVIDTSIILDIINKAKDGE